MKHMRCSYRRKHVWSESEDYQLAKLVSQYGVTGNWSTIAHEMDSPRNGKQCRERYVNHLNPNIKRTPWLPEEDVMIEELYAEWGSQWSRFMKNIPGRSDNAIKNRWHLLQRASKLAAAATMQSSNNPSSVVTLSSSSSSSSLSSVPPSSIGHDQSMKKQPSELHSFFDDKKACSMSIDDAESSSKRQCRRECNNSNKSDGRNEECRGDDFIKELCDTWCDHLDDETDDDCLNNSCVLSDRDRSNSFDDAIQFDDYIEAMLCDDTSLDAAMMLWDDADTDTAGHQSEKEVVVFETFGMHKP